MVDMLMPALSIGGLGLFFGSVLGIASIIFKVDVDERIPKIIERLPGANCGGCGFAGCGAFATALCEGNASPSGCTVGGQDCADAVSAILGVEPCVVSKSHALVRCTGCDTVADRQYDYYGLTDCAAAMRLSGGTKKCPYGCLGLGSCKFVCSFDAIKIVDGVSVIDAELCTACGACVKACPKSLIVLQNENHATVVACSSKDKGNLVNKYCKNGCIACKLCEKACKFGAITVNDNLAVIDYEKCTNCGKCVAKCPKKCIITLDKLDKSDV